MRGLEQERGWPEFSTLPKAFPLAVSQALTAQPSGPGLEDSVWVSNRRSCPLTSGL